MLTGELRDAGIRRPHLVAAYRGCHRYLAARNPAAYPMLRMLLPPGRRPHYDAIFAVAGYADCIVDDPSRPEERRMERFRSFRAQLDRELAGTSSTEPRTPPDQRTLEMHIAAAFAHTAAAWSIQPEGIRAFLNTLLQDLNTTQYDTFDELERYMHGVSKEPGRWVNRLLGGISPESAEQATAWGYAVYLMDFLADIGEDLALGRLYLPLDELDQHRVSRSDVARAAQQGRMTEPIRALVAHQAERIEGLLRKAEGWPEGVDRTCRELPRQCLRLTNAELRRLVRANYDVFRPDRGARLLGAARAVPGMASAFLRSARERHRPAPIRTGA